MFSLLYPYCRVQNLYEYKTSEIVMPLYRKRFQKSREIICNSGFFFLAVLNLPAETVLSYRFIMGTRHLPEIHMVNFGYFLSKIHCLENLNYTITLFKKKIGIL